MYMYVHVRTHVLATIRNMVLLNVTQRCCLATSTFFEVYCRLRMGVAE